MTLQCISVIIPTLNEAANLGPLIEQLKPEPNVEVIVADGGSLDETVAIAQACGCRVTISKPGRAEQMNAGAAIASGTIYFFLHADSHLPNGWDKAILEAMNDQDRSWGAFQLKLAAESRQYRLIETGANWRSRLLSLPYGDQGIFVRARVFKDLRGYPPVPVMEDAFLVRTLKRKGKPVLLPQAIGTSVRKWQRFGIARTTVNHLLLTLAFMLHLRPQFMQLLYSRLFKTAV